MNLHKKFIEEIGYVQEYIDWLEKKVLSSQGTPYKVPDEPLLTQQEIEDALGISIPAKTEDMIVPKFKYTTEILYDVDFLSYQTEIWFPRALDHKEREAVEGIINYWSAIPYVSVEGNYGIIWGGAQNLSRCVIDIDFTKSASDDYIAREILEKLADWIENGTPVKRDHTQKHKGVIKPTRIAADCP